MIGKNNWLLEAVQTADEPRAPWIRGVVASAVENPAIKAAILAIVDQKKPGGVEVWITGSRAKGNNRPDSDWDVVVLHPKAKPILPGYSGPVILEKKQIFNGDWVEAVWVTPSDWNHPGQYMSDCRQYGFRIR